MIKRTEVALMENPRRDAPRDGDGGGGGGSVYPRDAANHERNCAREAERNPSESA